MPDLEALLARFRQGDRSALSRLLTLLARGDQTSAILTALPLPLADFRSAAITGSAGVGKSTLIGKLIDEIRRQGLKVAVLACDPQSTVSGGALLGDRFRMTSRADDEGVFIRSLAAPSGRGAVAEHLAHLIRLLAAFGFDVVLIETVGAGQGDVTVAELADVVVLLLQPETGDDLQWEKAGVLEVADLIAVQKADLPRAEQVAAQVRTTLDLSSGPTAPVLLVSAKTGQGIPELWQEIAKHAPRKHAAPDVFDDLLQRAREALAKRLTELQATGDSELAELARRWRTGQVTGEHVGQLVLQCVAASFSEERSAIPS
jgi:LAO/AO transport system ATPase